MAEEERHRLDVPELVAFGGAGMRLSHTSHQSYPAMKAARVAIAAGAVASLAVLGACADNGKTLTAPKAPRTASSSSGGLGTNAGKVWLCVGFGSPAGNYSFVLSNENNKLALQGNGFNFPPWKDEADGGTGTTLFWDNGAPGHPNAGAAFTVSPQTAGGPVNLAQCVLTVERTSGDLLFPSPQVTDSWAGATITNTATPAGAIYGGTDCVLDIGVLFPQRTISPIPGAWSAAGVYAVGDLVTTNAGAKVWRALVANGPSATPPAEGATWTNAAVSGDCGPGFNPTRAFANFEHGTIVTFNFTSQSGVIPLFVIGDLTDHDIGDVVNFWGSQWWKNNPMSLFSTKGWESFKGFASAVDLTPAAGAPCGTWTSRVGNSPPPPDVIPDLVGIIVTDNVFKIGPGEGGNIKEIIIVDSDGNYGPAPGHLGGGEVVSIQCPAP